MTEQMLWNKREYSERYAVESEVEGKCLPVHRVGPTSNMKEFQDEHETRPTTDMKGRNMIFKKDKEGSDVCNMVIWINHNNRGVENSITTVE